jgi:hypothetical protein
MELRRDLSHAVKSYEAIDWIFVKTGIVGSTLKDVGRIWL